MSNRLTPTGPHAGAPAFPRLFSSLLTFGGTAFLLAAVIFFFAHNWSGLQPFAKIGLLEVAMVVSILGSWRLRNRTSRQAGLLAATVLVGPLLGVVGQTYQTGADSYLLFLLWFGLSLPWVVYSRMPSLWMASLLLLNIAYVQYWQEMMNNAFHRSVLAYTLWTVLNALAWLTWEALSKRGFSWMTVRWPPRLMALATFSMMVFNLSRCLLDLAVDIQFATFAVAVALVLTVLTFRTYRAPNPELFMLAVVAFGVVSVSSVSMFRALSEVFYSQVALLILGVFVVAATVVVMKWFRRMMAERSLPGQNPPWFVRALTLIGGWVAAFCFTAFLLTGELLPSTKMGWFRLLTPEWGIVVGSILLIGAIFCRRSCSHLFWNQLALALGISGLCLSAYGCVGAFDHLAAASFTLAFVQAFVFLTFPDFAMRMFTGGGFAIALAVAGFELTNAPIVVDVVVTGSLLGGGTLARTNGDSSRWRKPASFGLILVSLSFLGLNLSFQPTRYFLAQPTSVAIGIALCSLLLALATNQGYAFRPWVSGVLLIALGAVVFLTLDSPAIVAALYVVAVALGSQSPVLRRIAYVFLALFVVKFYHQLDATLLEKAGMLTGIGLALFVVRLAIHKQWNQGKATA